MLTPHESIILAESLLTNKDKGLRFKAKQLLFLNTPVSKLVETYLYDNEGLPQKLDEFPMLVPIYDQLPKKLLLKCSRKTLKSTLVSNIIVINLLRYEHYNMMYVSPDEAGTKRFSHDYLSARFTSPPIQKVIGKLAINDVFVKKVAESNSSVMLTYASTDPNRTRGPSRHSLFLDEIQGMDYDIIPVMEETMSILKVNREIFAGTPMTTDNTIHRVWERSNQLEWVTKCQSCNHWNTLTEDNNPMKMIQKKGLSCSKCGSLIDSATGKWVDFNPGDREMVGYHLAQPLLPFYNRKHKDWLQIYQKCYEQGYSPLQVYNEVLGLSFDQGTKRVTEAQLKALCVLGDIKTVYQRNKSKYVDIFGAVDWGVSGVTSRTVFILAGLRQDGVLEVFFIKIFKEADYDIQIREIAELCRVFQPKLSVDSGPDPIRGRMLGNLYDPSKTQLISYRDTVYTQFTDIPPNALDWSQTRWCLHRSDVMSFTFGLLEKGQILFPRWEDSSEAMKDIQAVFTEIKEDHLKAKTYYRHKGPDDFFHTLTWIASHAHLSMGNMFFHSPSSSEFNGAD